MTHPMPMPNQTMRKLKAGAKEIIIEEIPMRRNDLQQLTTRVIGTGTKLKTLRLQGCMRTSPHHAIRLIPIPSMPHALSLSL